jgi:hypothetical protein
VLLDRLALFVLAFRLADIWAWSLPLEFVSSSAVSGLSDCGDTSFNWFPEVLATLWLRSGELEGLTSPTDGAGAGAPESGGNMAFGFAFDGTVIGRSSSDLSKVLLCNLRAMEANGWEVGKCSSARFRASS